MASATVTGRMRDLLWTESGRRPLEEGLRSRAPRAGLIALCIGVVSAVLLDLAFLSMMSVFVFEDPPRAPIPIGVRFWLGILEVLSIAAFVASVAFGIRGSRTGDRRVFWVLRVGFWLLGGFLALMLGRFLRRHSLVEHLLPDELRALFSRVLSVGLGLAHAGVILAISLALNAPP